jgi:integrase
MARINIVKRIKSDGRWVMRSVPKKANGEWDWKSLPEGRYYVEWYEDGSRRREQAGSTVAQALEVQRRKKHQMEGLALGLVSTRKLPAPPVPIDSGRSLRILIDRYLDQVDTLKKPNTYRKYEAVLDRFAGHFKDRQFEGISTDELDDFVVHLKKSGMESNTVLHNVVIIAQFFKRSGRGGIMRQLHLPERTTSLPVAYTDEELAKFFAACDDFHRAMYSTFLMTGFREQEVMYLFWSDISLNLRTARVTSKPDLGFTPKRCEEREVPITAQQVDLLRNHPQRPGCSFVFPSPAGNREQHMLDHCKAIARAAGLDAKKFDLKTFRSTYATRMLRSGFDVRTVQHWMGHKSLETTMRYLVPATDVRMKLEQVGIPGVIGPTSAGVASKRRA